MIRNNKNKLNLSMIASKDIIGYALEVTISSMPWEYLRDAFG